MPILIETLQHGPCVESNVKNLDFVWSLGWQISTSSIDFGHDDDLKHSLTNDDYNDEGNDLKQPAPLRIHLMLNEFSRKRT